MAVLTEAATAARPTATVTTAKVLYIGGTGRTGSTLLEKALGQLDGVFAAGELTWLWYALAGDGRCSCGERLRECPVWHAVLKRAFGEADAFEPARLFALRRRFDSRYLPLMLTPRIRRRLLERLGPLPQHLESLYLAITETTGCRLLIDNSKEPHYSYILRSREALDIYFLHLVRDPRAVAHSWSRRRREHGFDGAVEMERRGPLTSAVYHDVSNIAAEVLWARSNDRYLRLRYEDFVADPVGTVARIGAFVGEPFDLAPLYSDGAIALRPLHTAWGNPNRFESGTIAVRPDDEWRRAMRLDRRLVAAAATLPLLYRYGYRLRTGSSAG